MKTFKLVAIEHTEVSTKVGKQTKTVDIYHYAADTGEFMKFHAHPTRAWNWLIDDMNVQCKPYLNGIIDAFCEVGGNCGERPFEEVISVLTVK